MKKFQQSSFQKHKPQAQQTTFVSSEKARNWSSVGEQLSDIFSEADEFTQFEAAPIQQGNQGIVSQIFCIYVNTYNICQCESILPFLHVCNAMMATMKLLWDCC